MITVKNYLISFFLFFFCFATVSAQEKANPNLLQDVRSKLIEQLKIDVQQFYLSTNDKNKLTSIHDIPKEYGLYNGGTAELQYFDENNHPVYYGTFNVEAAATTGLLSLKEGGRFGKSLSGKNLIVGVWDERRTKLNHLEFSDRLLQIDGSSLVSVHATHVTGTLLASGINPLSKGMAHEAKGWIFDWISDVAEMLEYSYDPMIRPEGILVSNHSYGILLGWSRNANGNWIWNGNSNIDPNEDSRFGFYSNKSQSLDNLTFAKPYYSVVWAAGNDRSDSGDGTKPPDGPEDTIGPEGVAKNVFTIGAVSKIENYTGPGSVLMSPFSSWGPVDDGRIKPDLVGVGVNVFSTAFTGNDDNRIDSYTTLSGSSMAAPNISGSLLLLQELYSNRNAGRFMWSSALKALTIHTAKEAGPALGPDYMFGWGLLDAERAGEIILNRDEVNNIIKQDIIQNGQTIEMDFFSNGEKEIKATIAWTDPAGSPVSSGNLLNPTDLMLVNDLDLRIFDQDGKEYFPWTLEPSLGKNAMGIRTKDNFRDNVEQILIENPVAGKYTLKISHKKELKNDLQEYSLVITTSSDQIYDKTLYWIGNEGNWEDNDNWSLQRNGISAGVIPDRKSKVIIDNDDISSDNLIHINSDVEIFSLEIFGKRKLSFSANNNRIVINNRINVNNSEAIFKSGTWKMVNENQEEFDLDFNSAVFMDSQLIFENGKWKLNSLGDFDLLSISNSTIKLLDGNLKVNNADFNAVDLIAEKINIEFKESLEIDENSQFPAAVSINYRGTGENGVFVYSHDKEIDNFSMDGNQLTIDSKASYKKFNLLRGNINILSNTLTVDTLSINKNGIVNIGDNLSLVVNKDIDYVSEGNGQFQLQSNTTGTFVHDVYRKYCLSDVNVKNVNLEGKAVINLEGNSIVTNADNWFNLACEDVLFADFTPMFACENSITMFRNDSQGDIENYLWNFANLGTSEEENPEFIFNTTGEFDVELKIANAETTQSFTKKILIIANPIEKPSIVVNNNTLVSFISGNSYQWYLNGLRIENATSRSFAAERGGTYQVAVFSDNCNRLSDPVVITSIEKEVKDPEDNMFGIKIGPNPTLGNININIKNGYNGPIEFQIFSMTGKLISNHIDAKTSLEMNKVLSIDAVPGVYLLRIMFNNGVVQKIILKN